MCYLFRFPFLRPARSAKAAAFAASLPPAPLELPAGLALCWPGIVFVCQKRCYQTSPAAPGSLAITIAALFSAALVPTPPAESPFSALQTPGSSSELDSKPHRFHFCPPGCYQICSGSRASVAFTYHNFFSTVFATMR